MEKWRYANTVIYYGLPAAPSGLIAYFLARRVADIIRQGDYSNVLAIVIYIVGLMICLRNLVYFGAVIYNIRRVHAYEDSLGFKYRVVSKNGPPGSGKSSSAGYEIAILSEKMWFEIQYLYWYWKPRVKTVYASGDKDRIAEVKEIVDSYQFFASRPDCAPCVVSNVPMEIKGKKVFELTRAHLEQHDRLPICCVNIDESGELIRVDEGRKKNRPLSISDFFRFCRHIADLYICMTEQDGSNSYIDARRVAVNYYILNQVHVLKPQFLTNVIERLKTRCVRKQYDSLALRATMHKLIAISKTIGFRKYTYYFSGNIENGHGESKSKTFVLPSKLNFEYDDRAYRNKYLCKDAEIKLDHYRSKFVQVNESSADHLAAHIGKPYYVDDDNNNTQKNQKE